MATSTDIVTVALQKSGVLGDGEATEAGMLDIALKELGDMLALWNQQRWLAYHLIDFSFASDGRTTPYTVGPASNFAMTPRPSRIEAAYVVQTPSGGLPVSTPLMVCQAYEEYALASLKTLTSFPQVVFLDTAYPVGNLYVYPWPNTSTYTLHILCRGVWPETVAAGASFANYPNAAIAAMKSNLARRLRQAYGKGLRPDTELNNIARDDLNVVKGAQVQVPELQMPSALLGRGKSYNIYGDNYGS